MARAYEKRETETEQAFEAFAAYRDFGLERSHVKVGEKLGKNLTLISKWSHQHQWVKRCHAYDRDVDRRKHIGDLKGVEDMRRRHTRMALDLQELGGLELHKMLKQAKKAKAAGTLDQGLVMKLIDMGSRLERLNRGEPGEIIQQTGDDAFDYSTLSLSELKTLHSIQKKARKAREANGTGDGD